VTRDTEIAARCAVADDFLSRGIGLLGRSRLEDSEALLITKTSAITMLFMRFAIDAVFIDRSWRVVRVASRLRPWLPVAAARGADAVIELPAGAAERTGTQAGDVLRISMTPHEGAPPPPTPA
jgi:uncharacterized membrane protein (UPF0127 family)